MRFLCCTWIMTILHTGRCCAWGIGVVRILRWTLWWLWGGTTPSSSLSVVLEELSGASAWCRRWVELLSYLVIVIGDDRTPYCRSFSCFLPVLIWCYISFSSPFYPFSFSPHLLNRPPPSLHDLPSPPPVLTSLNFLLLSFLLSL